MAWANVEDVEAILPEDEEPIPATGHARDRLVVNLEEATDIVSAFLEREYTDDDLDSDGVPDDVPPAVRRVVARVALRGFMETQDDPGASGTTSTMGPFAYHINWSKEAQAGDFYLTDSDKDRLEQYRRSTPRAVGHAPMMGSGCQWWV